MLIFCFGIGALVAVLFLVMTTYGWEKIWERGFGPADMGPIAFEDFAKGSRPNQALVCPDGVCKDADRDVASPIVTMGVDELRSALFKMLETEESLERVDDEADPLSFRFIQRSRLFRFPDTVRVRLFGMGAGRSTLAIYSQSQVGKYDFGTNKARVDRWLNKLKNKPTS